jgi:hypothetical protein
MRILDITFQAFFDDTRELVSDGVLADIEKEIAAADSEDTRKAAFKRGKERKKYLKDWLAFEKPLALPSGRNNRECFQALLQAVVSDTSNISSGLPRQHDPITQMDFVDLLLKMSSPTSPSGPSAPVVRNGSFLPCLKEAHRNLIELSREEEPVAQRSFISKLLIHAVNHLHIHFVPFHVPNIPRPGAPYRKPVFNSWISLGLQNPTPRALPTYHAFPRPSSSQHAVDMAVATALANDSNAEWCERGLTLDRLHTILKKSRLPSDWDPPSLSGVKYVDDTYAWVKEAYDASRPLHHLALIIGIIASRLIPKLFLPKNVNKAPFRGASRQRVQEIYQGIPWESRNKSGMSQKSIFVAMFTTFIIALYEPESPLRQYMKTHDRGGLGNPWTNKHCTCHVFQLFALFDTAFISLSGQGNFSHHSHSSWHFLGNWDPCY